MTATMTDLTIAQTIIAQMGGHRRLQLLVRARDFVAGDNFVMFRFSGSKIANKCKVVYDDGWDLYDFYLYLLHGAKVDLVYEIEGLYFDDLIPTFEEETGLTLSLTLPRLTIR